MSLTGHSLLFSSYFRELERTRFSRQYSIRLHTMLSAMAPEILHSTITTSMRQPRISIVKLKQPCSPFGFKTDRYGSRYVHFRGQELLYKGSKPPNDGFSFLDILWFIITTLCRSPIPAQESFLQNLHKIPL